MSAERALANPGLGGDVIFQPLREEQRLGAVAGNIIRAFSLCESRGFEWSAKPMSQDLREVWAAVFAGRKLYKALLLKRSTG
ncbi:MAG TPA: hypothetical protein VMH30_07295 [Verrucomicrobiae bacterium]|nr:hypothetical protein [Verrucomicrobiae bacterium]